jgi:hypothetical protein
MRDILFKKKIREVKMLDGTRTTYQYYYNNGRQIDIPKLRRIVENLESSGEDKIVVRGLNADKWNTLKGYDSELNVQDFEDYYRNRVEDPSKFEKLANSKLQL